MTTEKTVYINRLSPEAYQQLVSRVRANAVSSTTTPIEAGVLLGIQQVLQALREGFVIGPV